MATNIHSNPPKGDPAADLPILVVERSATLRHVIDQQLSDGLQARQVVRTAEEALQALTKTSDQRFSAVIIGWPTYHDGQFEQLLSELNLPDFQQHAVLVMADEVQPLVESWVKRRPRSAHLIWQDHHKIQATLQGLYLAPAQVPQVVADKSDFVRVLLVDDSSSIRHHYSRLLERNGYQVATAANIVEGMAKALEEHFDIAIIDYFMEGGNGDVLCRMINEEPRTRHIACALLTGTYVEDAIRNSLEAGAVECIFKDESDELFKTRIATLARMVLTKKSIESERQRLQGILASVGDGVYGVDVTGEITFINPAARELLGYAPTDPLIGEQAQQRFHHSDSGGRPLDRAQCQLQKTYLDGGELRGWETVFWRKDDDPMPVECTVFPLCINDVCEGSVVAFRDISERRNLAELRWQATHDPLTELVNRRHFEEMLESDIIRLRRSDEHAALLHIDLDRFKFINDTAGHAAGDNLLIEASRVLRSRMRGADILARYGGDEFTAILRNIDPKNLFYVANSFRETLAQSHFSYEGKTYRIHASIGVTLLDRRTQSKEEALDQANKACLLAKRKGRDQTYVFVSADEANTVEVFNTGWSARLRDALDQNRFVLCFQPIVPLAMAEGAEAMDPSRLWEELQPRVHNDSLYEVLIRMYGPDNEKIPPHAFLSSAERFDLMQEIDLWVISNALKQLIQIDRRGRPTTFSLNLSSKTLEDKNILQMLHDLLLNVDLGNSKVVFEITETSAITNLDAAREFINKLKKLGCKFALDDFGTGFSSFSYLKNLPVDYVKIDGQFVREMTSDNIDRTMVSSMNEIAHSLGMKTVAEYVENLEILKALRECGVDYIQGNFISKPLYEI